LVYIINRFLNTINNWWLYLLGAEVTMIIVFTLLQKYVSDIYRKRPGGNEQTLPGRSDAEIFGPRGTYDMLEMGRQICNCKILGEIILN